MGWDGMGWAGGPSPSSDVSSFCFFIKINKYAVLKRVICTGTFYTLSVPIITQCAWRMLVGKLKLITQAVW